MDASAGLPAVLIFVALILANAFFVAAEYSFVRVRGTQIDQLVAAGSIRAKLAARISARLDEYISASQLGVTLASLALGLVGEPAVARLIDPLFGWVVPYSETAFHVVSFAVSFGLITYVTIVLSELAPKYLAIQRSLSLALWCAYPLDLFFKVMYPFIWFVNNSANAVVRLFGIKPTAELDAHSQEELKMLVAISARKGVLQESERVIVGRALDFADRLVRQVMVPRTEIQAVPDDTPLDGLVRIAQEQPFTRYPVYRDDLDHIVGVLHLKDIVGMSSGEPRLARDVMRRVPAIPDTIHLDQALAEFRRQRAQLAIVIDEFGGTAGLVTLEDVLEELVGDVQDEFDGRGPPFREESPGVYVIDGLTSLADVRDRLGLDLGDEPYDTVGGMVFGRLGRVAAVGDAVDVEGFRFQVTAVDGRRVAQVKAARGPLRLTA
ncbi:MAG: hemolysin family protein [Chloroflexota bacterium]|nr:hemolysin family protein [Chloroflexota bacterium]